jgi:anti-anti-sigma factor
MFDVRVTGNSSMASPPTIVFHLPDRIDTWTIQQVEESFFVHPYDPGVHVILEMSNVTFMSSSGIRFLLVASDRLRKNGGGDILLAAMQKSVYDVLAVCNLDKRFQIFETMEAAQKHIGGT